MEFAHNADLELTSSSDIENKLDDVVKALYDINAELKKLEDRKSELRKAFFDFASEYIGKNQTLAHQFIEGSFSEIAAKKYVEDQHPEWRIVSIDSDGILIEEDPTKMKFVWTTQDNIQCSRNIAMIGAKFDIDALMQDKPDLANRVCSARIVYEFDEKAAQEIIDEEPELLPVFQDYAMIGKVQTKLSSPKIIEKEEDE